MSDSNGLESGDRRAHARIRRRLPCMLVLGERMARAIVTDLSPGGLYIAAHGAAVGGRRVDAGVVFPATRERPHIWVRAAVVRRNRVPPQLIALHKPGLALRVCRSSPNYERMIDGTPYVHDFRISVRRLGTAAVQELRLRAQDEDSARLSVLQQTGGRFEILSVKAA